MGNALIVVERMNIVERIARVKSILTDDSGFNKESMDW